MQREKGSLFPRILRMNVYTELQMNHESDCYHQLSAASQSNTQIIASFTLAIWNAVTGYNLNVKCGIHCLTFRYIFVVNYTFAVKKQNQHRLYL